MFTGKIELVLSDEGKALLERLAAALEKGPNCEHCMAEVSKVCRECPHRAESAPVNAPAAQPVANVSEADTVKPEPEPAPAVNSEPVEAATDPAPSYTAADVQRAVVQLASKGPEVKSRVRAVVKKYADHVSKIAEADYPAVMADLAALEG